MNILITNDDGIDAPGLCALENALMSLGHNAITIAPQSQYSECSHQINTKRYLELKMAGASRHSLNGSPADCVRIGLFTHKQPIDLICSGINAGGNLGVDVYYSGTVAAAREALIHGIPAIAFSNYLEHDQAVNWDHASKAIAHNFEFLLSLISKKTILNVNFPSKLDPWQEVPWIQAPLEKAPLPLAFEKHQDSWRYTGSYPDRIKTVGSDVDVCFSGKISITQIPLVHH